MKKTVKLFAVLALLLVVIPAAADVTPKAPSELFVAVQGDKLMLGDQEFFVKGVNYIGGRYLTSYIKDSAGIEYQNTWQMFHDFDAEKIDAELAFLKSSLDINSIRLFTPARLDFETYVYWHGWEPWFEGDGSINPLYLDRLVTFVALAKKNGLRVQIELFHLVQEEVVGKTFIPVGSSEEQFYKNYLTSLVSAFKDDSGVLSWEVGNEMLVNAPINYWYRSWWEERMLSFIRRMIKVIRAEDSNHLITSGEVIGMAYNTPQGNYTQTWFWPTAELSWVVDIDSSNVFWQGTPYRLYDLVDYISPHLYTQAGWINESIRMVRERSKKPVVLGEFGYMAPNPLQADKALIEPPQTSQYQQLAAAIPGLHLNGVMAWAPFPTISLTPGKFSVKAWTYGAEISIPGPPQRTIRAYGFFCYELFTADTLEPMPAATIFKGLYPPPPAE